ncbi:MAG: TerB family tellurite resistance protein, partial [Betaproteobacteria bacterium AqS2]|nr:TerB family tellurite resistance protein [Betaproteobacteria bacterium AqS2]
MIQTIIIAFIVYLVLTSIRRMIVNPRVHIDVNEQEGATTLRALYVIAHDIAHADGDEGDRERQMVVRMVRQLLGRPDLDEAFILREYREHSKKPLSDAELRGLSLRYRRTLFHCALYIALSDLRL